MEGLSHFCQGHARWLPHLLAEKVESSDPAVAKLHFYRLQEVLLILVHASRLYGPKCAACSTGIPPSDIVRRAQVRRSRLLFS